MSSSVDLEERNLIKTDMQDKEWGSEAESRRRKRGPSNQKLKENDNFLSSKEEENPTRQ